MILSQRSFAAGEIADALKARVDTTRYATGLTTLRNSIVMRHGGSANRPGTEFIAEVKDSTKTVRLIPFIFNSDQTYVLEFGNLYMRIYKDGVPIYDVTKTITGITQASQGVVTSTSHGLTNGQELYISGVVGMTQLNGRNFKVSDVTTHTFKLKYMDGSTYVNTTTFSAYSSGGTAKRVYTLVTPYVEADLQEMNFAQSADVLTLVHPNYLPFELVRLADDDWTIGQISFGPAIDEPDDTYISTSGGVAGGTQYTYYATSVSTTGEESLSSKFITRVRTTVPSVGTPTVLTFGGLAFVADAAYYNIFRASDNGAVIGYIGAMDNGSSTFSDIGQTPDTSIQPPFNIDVVRFAELKPSAVTYFQQRLVFGNTDLLPETIWASRSGSPYNFTYSTPSQDDQVIVFTMRGRQVNEIRHLLDLGKLVVLTTGGEHAVDSNSGILTPSDANPRQYSYNGSSRLYPLVVGNNALYVQARGSIVRDLGFDFQVDGYRGNDLTVFSAHLVDGHSLNDWAFQQVPNSIVWMARDDGVLLGLTYVKDQDIIGWHRHDFDGTVENVCVVPEGNEDFLYLIIKRTVNGQTKRYLERLSSRFVDAEAIEDSIFMDCALTYDGRNSSATTMTLSGGTLWTYGETLTLTASAATFLSSDVGNVIQLNAADGTQIRFEIGHYTSTTVVTGRSQKTVPVAMRSVAIVDWARAVDVVSGLWHLEGKQVSVLGDGFVIASPNNQKYDTITVTNGLVTLPQCFAVIHVGLPYISDLETLDIDVPQGETLADKGKLISAVNIRLEKTRGLWVGVKPTDDNVDPLENLSELKLRWNESYDDPTALKTGTVQQNILAQWNSNGRIFLRQVDPLPASILSVSPAGLIPIRGQ